MILVSLPFGRSGMTLLSSSNPSLISVMRVRSRALAVLRRYLLSGGGFDFGLRSFGVALRRSTSTRLMSDVVRRLYSLSLPLLPLLLLLVFRRLERRGVTSLLLSHNCLSTPAGDDSLRPPPPASDDESVTSSPLPMPLSHDGDLAAVGEQRTQ